MWTVDLGTGGTGTKDVCVRACVRACVRREGMEGARQNDFIKEHINSNMKHLYKKKTW